MIKKLLIANRGEIAIRIIQTCRTLNIKTVAVYSECDKDTLAIFLADESVCIGDDKPSDSYLNIPAILEAAKKTGCDSVHPGYGFLSENYEFAKCVEESGLLFIGPSPSTLQKTANKQQIKKLAEQLGIPVIPSTNQKNKYPLMFKPTYGGGGKGIKIINSEDEYNSYLKTAKREIIDNFKGNGFFTEKVIDTYKHIDINFIADKHGKISILPARDCSLQQHYQKVIEETPVSSISKEILEKMQQDTIKLVSAIQYDNIGTVEFLIYKKMNYYFLEINSRLQVEHTITEEATGIDLVEQQIRLSLNKNNQFPVIMKAKKCAIECRLVAEKTGNLNIFSLPSGKNIRLDTFTYQGYQMKPFYDSLIAKIITSDDNRKKAILKMKDALDRTIILGVPTNVDKLYTAISSQAFLDATYSNYEEIIV